MEWRARNGGSGEGRKRRRVVEVLVLKEDDGLCLEDYVIPVF
jgi:hypothetical protein